MSASVFRPTSCELAIGATEPFKALAIADTHLLFSDGRDNKTKYDVALDRYGKYVYTNVGRNEVYFLDALLYAKKNDCLLLHAGDLLDFVSPKNMEMTERLLELSGVDYFMAAGNHEYTHYSGAAPQTDMEYQEGRRLVPQVFKKNNINFDSRVINGINFIAMETFAKEYEIQFDEAIKKGLPVVLIVHVPPYTEELFRFGAESENWKKPLDFYGLPDEFSRGFPAEKIAEYHQEQAFMEKLRKEPLLKAIISGHVHCHNDYYGEFAPGIKQIVVGGAYYGCGSIINFC